MPVVHSQNFDFLSDAGFVRLPCVQELLGVSAATVWRMVKRGTLTPRKLSARVTAFNVGELRAVLKGEVPK